MPDEVIDRALIQNIIAQHETMPGALLPVLHGIQDSIGYIPDQALGWIADGLNLSRAEVHGVITFYRHFRSHAGGRHIIEVCRAEACQARGGRALDSYVREQLSCDYHQTTEDGNVTLEPVYCLGLCSTGPAISIDGKPYSRVNQQRFKQLLEQKL
ncbi:MAG: formate dehydrogenase subunit gamma [Gammaproteobacteria bacterium]|nr:formate dehydrogenase subunit gamma [Gammaproteobacteria bacterium]